MAWISHNIHHIFGMQLFFHALETDTPRNIHDLLIVTLGLAFKIRCHTYILRNNSNHHFCYIGWWKKMSSSDVTLYRNALQYIQIEENRSISQSQIPPLRIEMCKCQFLMVYRGTWGLFGIKVALTSHSTLRILMSLNWRHNDNDGVSNHQPHGCLLNRLFRRKSQKTPKLRVTGLCVGNSPGPVTSPHKWPVTRKMSPFDDVIMVWFPAS